MQRQSSQERRKERRRLIKVGREALSRGFSADLDDEVPVGVALMLYEKLKETGNAARASEAAALAEQVVDSSIARFEKNANVACRRGCSHCCVTVASVTPPEIFRVAQWVRQNRMHSATTSPAALMERARAKMRPTIDEMFAARVFCPAIVNDECGVHPARPINCRQFLSTSLPACISAFGGEKVSVPFVTEATDRGGLARVVLTGAMKAAGLPDTAYELSGALLRALEDERAEERWLAGEDVMAGVLVTPRPASTQEVVDRTAKIIAANQ